MPNITPQLLNGIFKELQRRFDQVRAQDNAQLRAEVQAAQFFLSLANSELDIKLGRFLSYSDSYALKKDITTAIEGVKSHYLKFNLADGRKNPQLLTGRLNRSLSKAGFCLYDKSDSMPKKWQDYINKIGNRQIDPEATLATLNERIKDFKQHALTEKVKLRKQNDAAESKALKEEKTSATQQQFAEKKQQREKETADVNVRSLRDKFTAKSAKPTPLTASHRAPMQSSTQRDTELQQQQQRAASDALQQQQLDEQQRLQQEAAAADEERKRQETQEQAERERARQVSEERRQQLEREREDALAAQRIQEEDEEQAQKDEGLRKEREEKETKRIATVKKAGEEKQAAENEAARQKELERQDRLRRRQENDRLAAAQEEKEQTEEQKEQPIIMPTPRLSTSASTSRASVIPPPPPHTEEKKEEDKDDSDRALRPLLSSTSSAHSSSSSFPPLREKEEEKEEEVFEDVEPEEDAEFEEEEEELISSPRHSTPAMKQQPMSESPLKEPELAIANTHQIDEILSIAQDAASKNELAAIKALFPQLRIQATQAHESAMRNLHTRTKLLNEWNNDLLALQEQLLDRVESLKTIRKAILKSANYLDLNIPLGFNDSDINKYRKVLEQQFKETGAALHGFESALNELNSIEVGLSQTNVTLYHDPDYENQINVAASVVHKMVITDDKDKEKALIKMRKSLGYKQELRKPREVDLDLTTNPFNYERAKVDTTKHYTLMGFLGTDTRSVNKPKGNVSRVGFASNLNTICSINAEKRDRNNFSLQVLQLREDLDPTHLLVKFLTNSHRNLGDLFQLPPEANERKKLLDQLYGFFSHLPKGIPELPALVTFLNADGPFKGNPGNSAIAKLMIAELKATLRDEKNSEVPSIEALRFAKKCIETVISSTDGKQLININGDNIELRRTMKYYCELMKRHFKDFPEEQRKYDYFDAQDKTRINVQGGFFSGVCSFFASYKDAEERAILSKLGFTRAGRRAATELLRDASEFDDQVPIKTPLRQELAAATHQSKECSDITRQLQSTNTTLGASGVLGKIMEAAKHNARDSQRLPQATQTEREEEQPRHAPAA
jgi:hypothetical protein